MSQLALRIERILGGPIFIMTEEERMPDLPPQPVVTQEIRIVDAQGEPRIMLSARDGRPMVVLFADRGRAGITIALGSEGQPSVKLANPNPEWPTGTIEIDAKGAHVKFDRPGGASSYLFLNNEGESGVVLVDKAGRRRLGATISADGSAKVERLGDDGKSLP